jgi:uncharacterized protein YqjF (DUF2071 family)
MHQKWGKLLFMHWRIDADLLRPLIPAALRSTRLMVRRGLQCSHSQCGTSAPFHHSFRAFRSERDARTKRRTYVHLNGTPGVWFFSLDCNNAAAVLGAALLLLALLQR